MSDILETLDKLAEKATERPWEFRATEHSGGIKFVVAPNAPRNSNGTEFIPADCSHGFNGRFIAALASSYSTLSSELKAARVVCEVLEQWGLLELHDADVPPSYRSLLLNWRRLRERGEEK